MQKRAVQIISIAVIACLAMSYIETSLQPGYLIKSICKVILFGGGILMYCFITKQSVSKALNIKRIEHAKSLVLFVLLAYFTIVIGFFLFKGWMDLASIKESLVQKEGLTKQNCLFIFTYIIFCNSFLEESFFRGFIFKGFKENKLVAYLLSGLLFDLYHIGIVGSWFNPLLLIVCIGGLAIAGMVLDFVCEKYDSLLASYLVHGVANLAINTIGVYLIFVL